MSVGDLYSASWPVHVRPPSDGLAHGLRAFDKKTARTFAAFGAGQIGDAAHAVGFRIIKNLGVDGHSHYPTAGSLRQSRDSGWSRLEPPQSATPTAPPASGGIMLAKRKAKGMQSRPIRMMIVGVPNVGKSSLINRLAGSKRVKVEDRPGVTRGKQWVRLESGIELLDMPGVLWPKFDDKQVGERLAYTGAIKDDVYDMEWVAMRFLDLLRSRYPKLLQERFKVTEQEYEGLEPFDLLELVGKKRGMMLSGGVVNTERAAITVLDEFRSGKIGRISLERPHTAAQTAVQEEV